MSDEEHEQTIAEDLVVTKYKMGGDIANRKYTEAKSRSCLKERVRSFRPVVQSANVGFPTQQQQQQQPCGLHARHTYAILQS